MDNHDEDKCLGVAGQCWFQNLGKDQADIKQLTHVNIRRNLRRCPQGELEEAYEEYAKETHDSPEKIRKRRPTALGYVAYPIVVSARKTPWGVLLLSADQRLNKNQRDAYLKHLREPGGFLDRIKHLVALQEMGKDLHCLQ